MRSDLLAAWPIGFALLSISAAAAAGEMTSGTDVLPADAATIALVEAEASETTTVGASMDAGTGPAPGDDTARLPTASHGRLRYHVGDAVRGAAEYAFEAPFGVRLALAWDAPVAWQAADVGLGAPDGMPQGSDSDDTLDGAAEQACAAPAAAACPVVGTLVDVLEQLTPDVAFGAGSDAAAPGPAGAAGDAATNALGEGVALPVVEPVLARAGHVADARGSRPVAPHGAPAGSGGSLAADGASMPWTVPAGAMSLLLAGAATAALVLGVGLYHRVARHHALEQETRRRVYDSIRAHPGARIGTLAAALDLSYKTVQRHAELLRRCGLIEGVGEGQLRWFARGTAADARAKQATIAAAPPTSQTVLRYLEAHPVTEVPDLCAALGLPRSSAGSAIRRMEAAGLLVKERRGKRLVVALARAPEPAPAGPAAS